MKLVNLHKNMIKLINHSVYYDILDFEKRIKYFGRLHNLMIFNENILLNEIEKASQSK